MLQLTVLLLFELRDQAFETGVFSADLLSDRLGAVSQVGTNITHERAYLDGPPYYAALEKAPPASFEAAR